MCQTIKMQDNYCFIRQNSDYLIGYKLLEINPQLKKVYPVFVNSNEHFHNRNGVLTHKKRKQFVEFSFSALSDFGFTNDYSSIILPLHVHISSFFHETGEKCVSYLPITDVSLGGNRYVLLTKFNTREVEFFDGIIVIVKQFKIIDPTNFERFFTKKIQQQFINGYKHWQQINDKI